MPARPVGRRSQRTTSASGGTGHRSPFLPSVDGRGGSSLRSVSPGCEPFVTSQGSAHTRFRRAVASGSPTLALAAAAELPRLGLEDALALVLVLTADPVRFDRATARWVARFVLEIRDVGADEAQLALAALRALRGPEREVGAQTLAGLCRLHGLNRAADDVEAWLDRRAAARDG